MGFPEYTHRGASGFPLGVVRPECDEIRLRSPWVVSVAGVSNIASAPRRSGLQMIQSGSFATRFGSLAYPRHPTRLRALIVRLFVLLQ